MTDVREMPVAGRVPSERIEWPPIEPAGQQVARPQPTTQDVQARDEGVTTGSHIDFLGQRFRLAESVGLMPLMQFAQAAKRGVDTDDMDGLAAMYVVIRDCIHRPVRIEPDMLVDGEQMTPNPRAGQPVVDDDTGEVVCDEAEWERFQRHAINVKAEGEDLNEFLSDAVKAISARKAPRRGNSSAGSPSTSERSRAASSSQAVPLPNHPDAADLVNIADMAS